MMNKHKLIFGYLAFGIIILLAIMLILKTVEGQTFINPGVCYTQNFSNSTCFVCANNVSSSFVNIILNPGESKSIINDTCSYDVSCSTNATPDKCIISNERINPGEEFRFVSQTCDIEVKARTCDFDEICGEERQATFIESYQIRYSNQSRRIQLNFGDKERIWNVDDNIDIKGSLEYICPATILNKTSAIVTAAQCNAIGEIYCGDAFQLQVDIAQDCNDKKMEIENKLENCRQDNARKVENSVCVTNEKYADLLAQKNIALNSSESCTFLEGQLTNENQFLREDKGSLTVILVLLVFTNMLTFVLYWNMKRHGISKAFMKGD